MGDYGANPNPDIDRIRQAAFGFKLAPQANLKVDQFSTASSLKVYACVRKIGSTRLHILVDPAIVPH